MIYGHLLELGYNVKNDLGNTVKNKLTYSCCYAGQVYYQVMQNY